VPEATWFPRGPGRSQLILIECHGDQAVRRRRDHDCQGGSGGLVSASGQRGGQAPAAAIGRGDAMAASILGSALATTRGGGFCNTVVTAAPEVTSYLIEHTAPARSDPFSGQLITAAVQVRSAQPGIFRPGHVVSEQLTPAERRVLKLLPTSTCPQIAASLYVAQCTVKTHLRAIYQKLRVASRSEALERALDLGLL
jgi:LuxR family transcriptional regulator, maltose regulon positive regulatory protein